MPVEQGIAVYFVKYFKIEDGLKEDNFSVSSH